MTDRYEYKEHDGGAFLLRNGFKVADFRFHMDCKEVLRLIKLARKYEFLEEPLLPIDNIYESDDTE